jgi:hypothetical protein
MQLQINQCFEFLEGELSRKRLRISYEVSTQRHGGTKEGF